MRISERTSHDAENYSGLLVVRVQTADALRTFSGTVLRGEPHIVQADGYFVDFVPQGAMLLTYHRDRPGMIGRVGTLLGSADVNIASMQVARETARGESIMVLSLDDAVPEPVFEKLRQEPGIEWVKVVQI